MTRFSKTLCLLAAVGLWQGCSSSSDDADGGKDGSTSDVANNPDTSGLFLSRGAQTYEVTAVSAVTDDCDIGASGLVGMTFPTNYVDATQMFSVGNQLGSPAMASFGTGQIGVTGTLTRENDATDGSGCSWHQKDVSEFTLTGGDVFTLEVTETQTMFNGCGTSTPTGGMCTTTFTATFSKVAATDGGTGG